MSLERCKIIVKVLLITEYITNLMLKIAEFKYLRSKLDVYFFIK